MPLCIEAIEMKHIVMKKPPFSGSLRHNSKGFFSIILLAICDACYNFTAIDVEQYGSKNDSAVLLNSKMKKKKKKKKMKKIPFMSLLQKRRMTHGHCFLLVNKSSS